MSFGILILVVVAGWSLLSVIVSVGLGATAKGRDAGGLARPAKAAVGRRQDLAS